MLLYALCQALLFWPLCVGAHRANLTYVASVAWPGPHLDPILFIPGLTIRIPGLAPPGWYQPLTVLTCRLTLSSSWHVQTTSGPPAFSGSQPRRRCVLNSNDSKAPIPFIRRYGGFFHLIQALSQFIAFDLSHDRYGHPLLSYVGKNSQKAAKINYLERVH